MRQIYLHFRRAPWVGPIAIRVFVGTLAALNIGIAQISFCPESVPGSKGVKSACTAQLDPFDTTLGSPQPQHPSPFNLVVTPEPPRHQDGDSQVVTLQQLNHRVPGKALKEEESAKKAFARNQWEEAIGHLKTAIQIDPWFVEARNNLAVLYIWKGNPDLAIPQLNEAIKLDPNFQPLLINLSIGYLVSARFADAEHAARTAVDLNRARNLPRYLLAAALYFEKKFTDEALRYAEETRDEYPLSHLFAARVLIERRDFEPAKGEIQTYLTGSGRLDEYVPTANSWLHFISENEHGGAAVSP
jgi:tetratricopeptide (TPR) repeat protein